MIAREAKMLEFMRKARQFVIPIYQRNYSWEKDECRQLWDDIMRAGKNDAISGHFVGSIVYVEKRLSGITTWSPYLVIDGQQRLTTISLLLIALAKAVGDSEPIDGFSAKKLRNYYLLNPEEDKEKYYKLLLAQNDKESFLQHLGEPAPATISLRINENLQFFKDEIAKLQQDLTMLCQGLLKLMVVDIALDRGQDNPQLIFESMNSTGRQLSEADLIRNFMLMGLEPNEQNDLYHRHWRPMEMLFGQEAEAYRGHFDAFMRYYLTLKTGTWPRFDEIYKAFKYYAQRSEVISLGMDGLIAELHIYATYYCAMALGKETDVELARAFRDIRELKVDVAYPLLLDLYHDCKTGMLDIADFKAAIRIIESYVFRRAVCEIPTNSLNKTFMTLRNALKKDRYLESFQAAFLLLQSYRRFPSDDEFMRNLKVRNLYTNRLRGYWPYRMENHSRLKDRITIDDGYTVEHIMPQNPHLSKEWQHALGLEWKQVQETWLHTLGNLTLTVYNSENSDKSFQIKLTDPSYGFKTSPLFLNKELQLLTEQDVWNEEAIAKRADALAQKATAVWIMPTLPADILDAYKKTPEVTEYSLDDHPHLTSSTTKELFAAFREAVMAIDPCVTEHILKLYIAYKAETNFVDVVPQASKLRLSLNVRFHDIDDPRGLCQDITNIGRWGNGDVEISLSSIDELPYVIALVRQAFDKQMGNGQFAFEIENAELVRQTFDRQLENGGE